MDINENILARNRETSMYSSCVTKRNLFFLLLCVCVRPLCQPRSLQGCQTWQHYFNKKYKKFLECKKNHICLEQRRHLPADWAHLLMCSSYKNSKSLEICTEKSQLDEIYTSTASENVFIYLFFTIAILYCLENSQTISRFIHLFPYWNSTFMSNTK